jgi:hypothetical protein
MPRAAASRPRAQKKAPMARHRGLVVGEALSPRRCRAHPRCRRTALGEEVDLVGDDLAAVALGAVLVFPLGVVDAPLDRHELALGAVLGDVLAETVEAGDAVEFAVLGGVAVFVLVGLAILAGGTVGHDRDRGDAGSALGGAGFGVASDAANEDNEIGHGLSPDRAFRVHPGCKPDKKRPRRSAPKGNPDLVRVVRAAGHSPATRPDLIRVARLDGGCFRKGLLTGRVGPECLAQAKP